MFGSRKNSKREKCLKMPQNPTRQVHALLGTTELEDSLATYKVFAQSHYLFARSHFFKDQVPIFYNYFTIILPLKVHSVLNTFRARNENSGVIIMTATKPIMPASAENEKI